MGRSWGLWDYEGRENGQIQVISDMDGRVNGQMQGISDYKGVERMGKFRDF